MRMTEVFTACFKCSTVLERLQFPVWVLHCIGQQLQYCISGVIEAQVQLSQVGWVRFQSQKQVSTAFLSNLTA